MEITATNMPALSASLDDYTTRIDPDFTYHERPDGRIILDSDSYIMAITVYSEYCSSLGNDVQYDPLTNVMHINNGEAE